jgi:hypothetical protein
MEFSHFDAIGFDAAVAEISALPASEYEARELNDLQLAIVGSGLADPIAF